MDVIQNCCTYTARCTYQIRLHLVHMLMLWDELLLRQYLRVTCTSNPLNLMMLMMVMTVLIANQIRCMIVMSMDEAL